MVIAFLGPDGSGKSSLIKGLREEFGKAGILVQLMHFRVQWNPSNVPVTDPYRKPPHPYLVSVVKILVWVMQYNLWRWTRWFWYANDSVVIFDRFLTDCRIDPRRYRLNAKAARFPFEPLLIPRPRPVFILDVPAEELQRRKPEVTAEESEAQVAAYKAYSLEKDGIFLLDGRRPPGDLLQLVIKILKDHHAHTP